MHNRAAGSRFVQLGCLVALCLSLLGSTVAVAAPPETVTSSGPVPQDSNLPSRNPDPLVRVEDPSSVLDADQAQTLNSNLERLSRLGTEMVVFIRDSNDGSTSQPWLAEDLRIGWGVESSTGARNGLVVVVSADVTDPSRSTMAWDYGLHTFPIRQLTANGFEHLVGDVALPQVQQGDVFGGLLELTDYTLGTVIDRTGLLTERQVFTLDGDLRRLGQLGLPTLVSVRFAENQAANDASFAEDTLDTWAANTDDTANRSMVVVVTLDPETPENSTVAFAAGTDALPIRQLTDEEYQAILDGESLPAIQDGDLYLGLAYAIRRAINFAEYTPPTPAPLNELQEWVQTPLHIVAAALVQVALLLYVLVPALIDRRLTLTPSSRAMATYVTITAALALLVGVAGIFARNRSAALVALAAFLLATVVLPLIRAGLVEVIAWRERHRDDARKDAVNVA